MLRLVHREKVECCGNGQIIIATKLYPSKGGDDSFYQQDLKIDYFANEARKITFRIPICLIPNFLSEKEFTNLFIENVKKEFPSLEPHAKEIVDYMEEKRKWLKS